MPVTVHSQLARLGDKPMKILKPKRKIIKDGPVKWTMKNYNMVVKKK